MKTKQLASLLKGHLQGDGDVELYGVAGLGDAGPDQLSFAESQRALAAAARSRAGCVLVPGGTTIEGKTTIAVAHPKLAFIHAAAALKPPLPYSPGIHPTAVIAADARLGEGISVGPYVVIESSVSVGPRTRLAAGVFLGEGARVGADCVFHPRVTLYPGVRIGDRVVLHAGVVIGSDGFGYVFDEGKHHKFPQLGQVMVEDDVEIGSNTTVDRGSLNTTVIGQGTKIDNLCQIAHNVKIGRHCVIAAQTGISGSAEIGDYVVMGGQVGIADHVRVEDHVIVGAQAGVPTGKVLRKGVTYWGTPARPLDEFKRMYAHVSRLPSLAERVKEIARRLSTAGPETR